MVRNPMRYMTMQVLCGCEDLVELAGMPDLATVDVSHTVPGDAPSMALVCRLALAMQALGKGACFLM